MSAVASAMCAHVVPGRLASANEVLPSVSARSWYRSTSKSWSLRIVAVCRSSDSALLYGEAISDEDDGLNLPRVQKFDREDGLRPPLTTKCALGGLSE